MSAFENKIAIDGSAPYSGSDDDKPSPSDFANQPKEGKTWKILKMKHEGYDVRCLDTKKQDILYQGGFQMNDPDVAILFCPKLKNEEDNTVYKERVQSAAYIPTFSKLLTGLVSNLFSQDLSVMEAADHDDPSTPGDEVTDQLREYYKLFQNDCDGCGTTLHNFMRHTATKGLKHGFAYFGVDYPKGEVSNLLEQEQLGLDKPRMYKIDSESVYDWKMKEDSKHELEWIKLLCAKPYQPTPFDPPMCIYVVKTWFLNDQGMACYECYESQPLPLGKEPKDKDVLQKTDEGVTSFKSIPIIYWCLDEGVAVGQKLAPLAAEHFNRTTIENHSTNKACLTVPVVYRGEMFAGDSLPDPGAMNMHRGQNPRGKVNSRGVLELGEYNKDKFDIVEAEGKALAFIHKQNEDLDEKMHSVVHQMAQSLKQARSQSGKTAQSKQEDRRSTEMLLTAIADEIYTITQKAFELISESRGEDIVWEVKGLSALAVEDREELTKEAAALDNIPIPSLTFKKEYHYRLASRLVEGTDQRTLQTIRAEIEEGLDTVDQTMRSAPTMPTGSQNVPPPKVNAPGGSDLPTDDSDTMPLGPAGHALLPDGAHLQTGEHIDSQTVYDHLAEDYNEKDIQWVLHIPWTGPQEVPLSAIDFSNKDNWQASQDEEHVQEFADKVDEGQTKPIVLVNNPSNDNKMEIVDGHHRALAHLQAGTPIPAYIGSVGSNRGPWDKLHAKQAGKKEGSGPLQSQQMNQTSIQKEVSKQVSQSEKAVGGKTK